MNKSVYILFIIRHSNLSQQVSIGFFTADGNNYRHPYSNDQSLFPNLLTHSNVGVAGRWIYRIDTATITDPYGNS